MTFEQFLKEFFRLPGTAPGNYLDTTHMIIASIVTVITIALGVVLGLKFRDKDEKAKIKMILPFAIAMWALYGMRIFMIIFRGYYIGGDGWKNYVEGNLPLFLCDIQYFALIAVCFGKEKIRKIALDFCLCLGILTFAMGVWLNAGTYGGNQWWSSCYFYEMAVHAIPGGIAIFITFSGLASLHFKDIWKTLLVLLVFEAIALVVDYSIDANYMFFKSDSGTPFFIFTNWAGGNQYLYSFYVWCGMTFFVCAYYGIWELVALGARTIKQRKAA